MKNILGLACTGALTLLAGCAISLEPVLDDTGPRPDATADGADVAPMPDVPNNPDVRDVVIPPDGNPCTSPRPETCNGIDDDCNGRTDDGLGQLACGVGACQRSVYSCLNGSPAVCMPGIPMRESCNGIDDDCNGRVDDNGACIDAGPCDFPSPEVCDGFDNDCNGLVDDGLGNITCGVGECQHTVPACLEGGQSECFPLPASPEVCDGLDNDCDGVVDNGLMCQACGGTRDPLDSWFYHPGIEALDIDESEFGSGTIVALSVLIPPMDLTPMVQRAGDCVYDPVGLANTPSDLNLGTIRVVQAMSMLDLTSAYNVSSQHYDNNAVINGDVLLDGLPTSLTIAGGPNGPMATSQLIPPPRVTLGQIGWPGSIVRGQPMSVRFPVQTDSPDLTAVLMVFDGMGQSMALCAVPACRGSVTLPGAITANLTGTQQLGYLRMLRTQQLPQYTPAVRYRLSYGAIHGLQLQ